MADTIKFNLGIKKLNVSSIPILTSMAFNSLGIKKLNVTSVSINTELQKPLSINKINTHTLGLE